jgi:hypothetical protein
MKFQLRNLGNSIFEVYDTATGQPHYRGPMDQAARELSRLNVAAMPVATVSRRKAERLRQLEEKRQAGMR